MTALSLGMPRLRRADPDPADRPRVPELVDTFGRVARDLRISLTEKCSLRCVYCMPAQGLPAVPRRNLLTAEEIARLACLAARDLGVREIRLTGGEPLMRGDLEQIVAATREGLDAAGLPHVPIAMTTNGIGLDRRSAGLRRAGIARVNISLDTIDRDAFASLTRRDRLEAVLAGVRGAVEAGLGDAWPIKVNAVMLPQTLSGAADLLAWCLAQGVRLRFIEQMPLDADGAWTREGMVTAAALLEVLGERFELVPVGREDPAAPAEEWLVDGGPGRVGVIASVTRSFCASCDRTRLTAEGTVRSCLFSDAETDLRSALRSGADDAALGELWRGAMWRKWAGHGIGADGFAPPVRSMGEIGG